MTVREKRVVRFSGLEFGATAGTLLKSGTKIPLSKRSALLLEELISRRGEVVTRERLVAVLWGDGTHVDFDDGLNHAVKRLRDALCDDPKSPRFIERVPGVGYRFIAEIEDRPPRAASEWRSHGVRTAAVAVGLAACLLVAVFLLLRRPGIKPETVEATVPVVAVLPFQDLSDAGGGKLFAASVSEAITDELSRVAGLRVTAHASAKRATGLSGEIASQLRASHLVSGSVIRDGPSVRINVRLTDAEASSQTWASAYEGQADDPLSVLADVPRAVASAIGAQVTPEEEMRLAAVRPVRADVMQLYWDARADFEGGDLDSAVESLESTIELDPDFAPAYSLLADAHLSLGYWERQPSPMLKRAETAALRALRLDETLAEPHLLRGRALSHFEWKWEEADKHFRKAIELNPNHVQAYLAYGKYLAVVNRTTEAAEMAERAVELDPLSASTNGSAADIFHASRNYSRAADLMRRAVAMHPDGLQYHVKLACIYGGAGDYQKAHQHVSRAVRDGVQDLRARAIQAWIHTLAGDRDQALRVVLEPSWDPAHRTYYTRAFLYNAIGDQEKAFEVLEQCVEDRWPLLAASILLPPFDQLRDDPRFSAILDRMGLHRIREANAGRNGQPGSPR